MGIAALLWRIKPRQWDTLPLELPLGIYLANFVFAAVISIDGTIYPPILLGVLFGVLPVVWLYRLAMQPTVPGAIDSSRSSLPHPLQSEKPHLGGLAVSGQEGAE